MSISLEQSQPGSPSSAAVHSQSEREDAPSWDSDDQRVGLTVTGTWRARLGSARWIQQSSTACGAGRAEDIATNLRAGSIGSTLNTSTAGGMSSGKEAGAETGNQLSLAFFTQRPSPSSDMSRSKGRLTLTTLNGKPTLSVGLT